MTNPNPTPEEWDQFLADHMQQLDPDSQLLLIEIAELNMAASQLHAAQERDVFHTLQQFIDGPFTEQ